MILKSMMNNLPEDFEFEEYDRIWSYTTPPLHQPEFQVDLFARAGKGGYSLIGEVKNRKAKFTVKEAHHFLEKADALKNWNRLASRRRAFSPLAAFSKTPWNF